MDNVISITGGVAETPLFLLYLLEKKRGILYTIESVRQRKVVSDMYEILPVTGCIGGECFLLLSPRHALMVDAGFGFCAPKTARNVRAALGGRPLEYVLLSHSHYDHVLGVPAIKRAYPTAKVVAGALTARILAKQNVRATMLDLDRNAAQGAGLPASDIDFGLLAVDVILRDGESLELADTSVRLMESPGHTRCSVNYYFTGQELLAASETVGIMYPKVVAAFVVSYKNTLRSIKAARALKPAQLLVSHCGSLSGGHVPAFFENARCSCEELADFVVESYRRLGDVEQTVQAMRARYYTGIKENYQPLEAFLLNNQAMVPRLLRELGLLGNEEKTA